MQEVLAYNLRVTTVLYYTVYTEHFCKSSLQFTCRKICWDFQLERSDSSVAVACHRRQRPRKKPCPERYYARHSIKQICVQRTTHFLKYQMYECETEGAGRHFQAGPVSYWESSDVQPDTLSIVMCSSVC